MANKNFIDSNKKTKYGRHDVEFWIGTVVAYASQEEQINEGFGWMYKVRIDGDHSKNEDQVKDDLINLQKSLYTVALTIITITLEVETLFKKTHN